MARQMFVATIQIAIHPDTHISTADGAAAFFNELLSKNRDIFDWAYLKVGNQYLYPSEQSISNKQFQRNEFFDPGRIS